MKDMGWQNLVAYSADKTQQSTKAIDMFSSLYKKNNIHACSYTFRNVGDSRNRTAHSYRHQSQLSRHCQGLRRRPTTVVRQSNDVNAPRSHFIWSDLPSVGLFRVLLRCSCQWSDVLRCWRRNTRAQRRY